jgi:hypothetical protein
MILQAVIFAASLAVVGTGAFFYGQKLEAEGWAEVVANLDSELNALQEATKARDARDAKAAKSAVAKRASDAKQQEAEREKWIAGARAEWAAYLERMRGDPAAADADPALALSSCRAERDATRTGLERVLTAGERARAACDRDRTQLGALLGWLNEVTR